MTRKVIQRCTIILVTLAVMSGCAKKMWMKDGATQDEFARDRYQCIQESKVPYSQAYVNQYFGASSQGVGFNKTLFQACMEAQGYRLVEEQSEPASSQRTPWQPTQTEAVRCPGSSVWNGVGC